MKIAHIVPVTPHQCGLYETTREQAAFERKVGLDSFIFDPRDNEKKEEKQQNITKCPACGTEYSLGERTQVNIPRVSDWTEDRGVCTIPFDVLKNVDLIVSHSGLNEKILQLNKPFVHIAHGRPYSSFLIEHSGQTAIYSYYLELGKHKNFRAAITLWQEYKDYLELLFPNVSVIDAGVDLEFWTPGESNYDFHGHKSEFNAVCSDVWRLDKNPFHVINAFRLFNKKYPNAKLHIYAAKQERAWGCLINKCKEDGCIGEVLPMVKNLGEIYKAADLLITPHDIATRTVRESLATGLNICAGPLNRFTPYKENPENLEAYVNQIEKAYLDWNKNKEDCVKRNRCVAEKEFNLLNQANEFKKLYEGII